MRLSSLRRSFTIAVTLSALGAVLAPSGASAEVSSVYPPTQEARDFAAGQGGWVGSSSFDSCVLAVTCPTVTNSFESAGGAGGEGHIRSGFSATLTAVGSAMAVWQSPQFTYEGAGGGVPEAVSFAMARRADVGDLLSGGSTATYAVDLIDVTAGGVVIPVIPSASLAGADAWTVETPIALSPGQLTLGNEYAIRITSTYTPGAVSLLVTGNADFDNVALTATRADDPPPTDPPTTGPAHPGGDGDAGGNAAAGSSLSRVRLRALLRGGPTGSAMLRGKRLFIKVNCPTSVGRACRITVQGLLGKGRPATARRTVKVGKGKGRRIALRVRPRLRAKVVKRKRLLVRERVRAGKLKATIYKRRKLIRR
ncbi:MAG TPA: hypothetical protein VF176_03640 [Solirubrobacterales bacterium]